MNFSAARNLMISFCFSVSSGWQTGWGARVRALTTSLAMHRSPAGHRTYLHGDIDRPGERNVGDLSGVRPGERNVCDGRGFRRADRTERRAIPRQLEGGDLGAQKRDDNRG